MRGVVVCSVVVLTAVASPVHAVTYVDAPPLTKVVRASVQDCAVSGPTQVPLITWGADEATVFGNGNKVRTAPGSVFADEGLDFNLVREDVFENQVKNYLTCKSPYLRGTLGMMNMAAEIAARDPRTEIVPFHQLSWSVGGDAIVVKETIKTAENLCSATIAVQRYGPHVDYVEKVLADACPGNNATIKWTKDLTGTDNTPMAAFQEDSDVDAVAVIIPDAFALTSGGTVGDGSEDSVRGARILLSTKTLDTKIADLYSVRRDYYNAHRNEVERFAHALLVAQERLQKLFATKENNAAEYQAMISAVASILLDSPSAIADAEGMYGDCKIVGFAGNVKFFTDSNYPRRHEVLVAESQDAFVQRGLLSKRIPIMPAVLDYEGLKKGLTNVADVVTPRFNQQAVARTVTRMQQQERLGSGELISFVINFAPNQNAFSTDAYKKEFERVINLMTTYGGALITVEGHSDPLEYLRKEKAHETPVVLQRLRQSAKNLSFTRANAVRDSVVRYAESQGASVDQSQFAVIGHGINNPLYNPPNTEKEWFENMRVEFRMIQVEAEASVFAPL